MDNCHTFHSLALVLEFLMGPKFLPLLMVIESLTAALVYAYNRDWRHAAYWVSSACIILSVTL